MTTSIDFATIISAAIVAFAVSALILLLSNLWASFSSRFKSRKGFRGRILFEAGEELRRQVRRRDALCYRHIIAMLVFSVCFLTILVLGRRDWWAELPVGIWMVLGAALVGAMVYYLREFLLMVRSRARLAYLRDANIALGHGLLHSTVKGNRVFHSIPVGGDIVDNVVIGANGVYAVNVIVPPKHSAKTVQLKKDKLFFEPGNDSVSLVEHHNKIKSLARELTPVVGHPVKVLSVIGVPGCQVITTGSDKHLVVNESNCVMLTGWRVPDAYLMSEEVQKIGEFLLWKCSRRKDRRRSKDRREEARQGKERRAGKKRQASKNSRMPLGGSLKAKGSS